MSQGATPTRPRILRRAAKLALVVLLSGVLSSVALEVVYRLAWFDPYRGELREYNVATDLAGGDERPTVLCMGDSLTAGRRSWPALLRRARPGLRVINAGIPGSCVLQVNLVAERRFGDYRPAVFVYQLNVGNDLLNLRYPVSWSELSVTRNLYWSLSRRLQVPGYLNYKLGQLARTLEARDVGVGPPADLPAEPACEFDFARFDPIRYTPRERLYLQAEPRLIENQALLRPARRAEFQRLLAGLRELLAHCRPGACRAFVLVVPHAAQVDEAYQQTMLRLGARIDEPERLLAEPSPFVTALREDLERSGMNHVRLIDALSALRREEREGNRTYFLEDPHLTACGQQALATLLNGELQGVP